MKITNARYATIPFNWTAATLPIKPGTPIGIGGVCNGAGAIGIVTQAVKIKPVWGDAGITVLVGGDVELAEVEKEYGASLSADALTTMSGIRFYGSDGTPTPDYIRSTDAYVLPAATELKMGGVKMCAGVAPIEPISEATAELCAEAINAIITAMQAAGQMGEAPAEDAGGDE